MVFTSASNKIYQMDARVTARQKIVFRRNHACPRGCVGRKMWQLVVVVKPTLSATRIRFATELVKPFPMDRGVSLLVRLPTSAFQEVCVRLTQSALCLVRSPKCVASILNAHSQPFGVIQTKGVLTEH
jgi:hypothetical protein